MKKLRESFANILNETNLFTKNLLKHVTVDNLIQIFKQFGEVTSVAIKEIKSVDPKFPSETNFGFICFAKKEDAKQALVSALKDQTLQELYKDRNIYLTYHYRKEQYSVYKEMKKRTMAKYFSARQFQNFQNPMFLPFPMPVPPPMFAGNQFSNFPPQYMGNMMGNPPQYPPHYQPNRYHSPDNNFHRGGGQVFIIKCFFLKFILNYREEEVHLAEKTIIVKVILVDITITIDITTKETLNNKKSIRNMKELIQYLNIRHLLRKLSQNPLNHSRFNCLKRKSMISWYYHKKNKELF